MSKRLPEPDALVIEQAKLTLYLLNFNHADGASKARFFKRFGFSAASWTVLETALRTHGRTRDVLETTRSSYGTKYLVRCSLPTPDERNPCIDSVWIKEGEGPPRLVTAYPHWD